MLYMIVEHFNPGAAPAIYRRARDRGRQLPPGLEYLDSSGIGELVRNYLSVVKKGGAMKVVGLAPKVEEILKVTQLYQVFPEFPDEESALESFPSELKKPFGK